MSQLVFTLCSKNYLAAAITLGNSIKAVEPETEFLIGLVDEWAQNEPENLNIPHKVILATEVGIENFDSFVKRYNIIELNTSVKPFYFQYFFKNNYQKVVYLDPDIMVFSPLNVIWQALDHNQIATTPHMMAPTPPDGKHIDEDTLNLMGVSNFGFVGLSRGPQAEAFVNWWANKLTNRCYNATDRGLFVDQIWSNFITAYYTSYLIIKHKGCNAAYWNFHERNLTEKNGKFYFDDDPLVFFHFSNYNPKKPDEISRWQNRYHFDKLPPIYKKLFDHYGNTLLKNRYDFFKAIPCQYVIQHNVFNEKMLATAKKKNFSLRLILALKKLFGKKFVNFVRFASEATDNEKLSRMLQERYLDKF